MAREPLGRGRRGALLPAKEGSGAAPLSPRVKKGRRLAADKKAQWPIAYIALPPRLRKHILHFSQLGNSHELHAIPWHIAPGHGCSVPCGTTFLHCPLAHKG